MPIKAATASGSLSVSNVVKAIDYAIEQQVDIINMSFGATSPNPIEEKAIQSAIEAGIIVISSSGNSGKRQNYYPASYKNVISVGAIDEQEKRASFSSYNPYVDFVAPAVHINTYNNSFVEPFITVKGTSFASPYFAGVLASLHTLFIEENAVDSLLPFTKDLGNPGKDEEYGHEFVQPFEALNVLRGEPREVVRINDPKKEWAITFNQPVNIESITNHTVSIVKGSGLLENIDVEYSLSKVLKTIYLKPSHNLDSGNYWLIVNHKNSLKY
ncbi:subtilase family protein [Ureibacillus xyleni]|uniref:Subtilase family protein n=1 Tax=Ureibacillus xyleni TaxID=614648 RepID=A0A285RE68_9BACL|nr:S8 family serine peptidase [Ureibacillus xyleni]SOB90667.1 subtilase family protein [Ureibacillus xyleni]